MVRNDLESKVGSRRLKQRWLLKDYVFAAFMTIGIAISSILTVPLTLAIPLPGVRTIVWAPFAGVFLTLGMARLQRSGSVALMIGILAVLLGRISLVITAFLAAALLLTELIMLPRGGYRGRINRLLGNVVFFSSATVSGAIVGAYTVGGTMSAWLSQSWILLPMTLLSGLAGAIGWWLGELVVKQLQRAGKLDTDV
jgi:energy-coupling factor transport system substrate-specific component